MNKSVRVRYAPSPTGEPHVGNIRTALFNWLFARHSGGTFIVRIEDTDVVRKVEGALEAILDSLRWLGLDWDEGPVLSLSKEPGVGGAYGPYIQTERKELYQVIAQRLLETGYAYKCYCSPDRLAEMRAEQRRKKQPPRYDRRCRDLDEEERAKREASGIVPVIRFKTPLAGETSFYDLIRGQITVQNSTLDDLVLLKSDGYPTYHLAVVTDDHFMEITHILRADEWLPSTPRHVLMYQALGWEPPLFAHLPMILGPDRSKLSKRHGATSVTWYREHGYLPEAMVNFLALLGWSLDDHTELLSREELIRNFSLERIGKTGAIFSLDKLLWMNGVYIRSLSPEDLMERVMPSLDKWLAPEVKRPLDKGYVRQIIPLIQERLKTLDEIADLTKFFFLDEVTYEYAHPEEAARVKEGEPYPDFDKFRYTFPIPKDMTPGSTLRGLEVARQRLDEVGEWNTESLEGVLRPLAAELGLKTGQFFGLLRVATTGRTAAPPLFQTIAVLGRERCLRRIEAALKKLDEQNTNEGGQK